VAIALIALAIAAMILLPLLRRPARKPSAAEASALEFPETATPAVEPSVAATTRTKIREPVPAPPRPTPGLGAAAPAALDKAASPPSPAPTPKPLRELLEGFEMGPGGEGPPPAAALQGGAPGQDIKAPLLESEPPTASSVQRSTAAKQEKESPAQTETALPPELRLDGLDFDFGDLTLDKTARQPSELPPLEMKPAALGAKKPFEPLPLGLGITEPATEPPSLAPTAAPPADSAKMGLKFEFADVTQELARYDTGDESLKLGEALQGLSGEALKPGGRAEKDRVAIPTGGMDATDYVETKLDLAMAYLDMGDQFGARSLLDEVLREGNAMQKERAEGFLKKLG
jgi:FimV-like protein